VTPGEEPRATADGKEFLLAEVDDDIEDEIESS
jgi:hypothetical protein